MAEPATQLALGDNAARRLASATKAAPQLDRFIAVVRRLAKA